MIDQATDHRLLRRTFQLAREAVAAGNHPFGALLSDSAGEIVLEARNSVVTDADPTAHAETNLARQGSRMFDPDERARFALFTSCEPCAMCAGAIFWTGFTRVSFALSERALLELIASPLAPMLATPSARIFGPATRATILEGPDLESEAAEVHAGFWS